ncbi:MAG TPA: argininosuccinate lyase [Thermoanaerobaculia bacterium]|nr:argininosuccinate lyase [Thermoanaerobaculia bacterium]
MNKSRSTTMWGGRFASPPDPRLRALNDSLAFDWELVSQDVEGSIAWSEALVAAGALTSKEQKKITAALREIGREAAGMAVPLESGAEDVHSWVESQLRERVGPLAGKLHTGRSRNDQVATDLRLWLKKAIKESREAVVALAHALAVRGGAAAGVVMPGYTHLKQAEPITFGHWCLAYAEMLMRDVSRFESALERADECPLGAGALAGTPLSIDRAALARALGFARPSANSLDAVSDRDAAADYLYAASLLFVHLSRLAEDLIFFSSDEAGYLELPDSLATGSSRMPQKKNPDLLELTRGFAGRSIGELTGFLSILKALPMAYNKDLQLDKEPLFRTRKTLKTLLPLLVTLIENLQLNEETMRAAAGSDSLMATELADALASRGVPFREGHASVSSLIGASAREGKSFRNMKPVAGLTATDLRNATPEKVVARKSAAGGTAPASVKAAAKAALKRLDASRGRKRQ